MKKKTLFVAAAATSSFTAFLIFDSIAATALYEPPEFSEQFAYLSL
jgi:hypothetical protein